MHEDVIQALESIIEDLEIREKQHRTYFDERLAHMRAELARYQQEQRDALWQTEYGLTLNEGDSLLVTQAFWDEKIAERVMFGFSRDPGFVLGALVKITHVALESVGIHSTELLGGSTHVSVATAIDMRRAWLAAQKEEN